MTSWTQELPKGSGTSREGFQGVCCIDCPGQVRRSLLTHPRNSLDIIFNSFVSRRFDSVRKRSLEGYNLHSFLRQEKSTDSGVAPAKQGGLAAYLSPASLRTLRSLSLVPSPTFRPRLSRPETAPAGPASFIEFPPQFYSISLRNFANSRL